MQRVVEREEKLASRVTELEAAEGRMRRQNEHLRDRECELEIREWRVEMLTELSAQPAEARTKSGRNECCPCGSGVKYKHCHGLPGR